MRVLVTGGTGYVGCHTVAALAGQGHQVRLLVRARDRIAPALDPLGVTAADVVVGDVTSAVAVEPLSIPAGVVVDDSETRQELGLERRELRETLADTVRWLAARGLVTARQAGTLAS